MESATDAYCIEKILDGKTEYFSVLMTRHAPSVFSLMTRMAANREDAEELTQDTFLKAFRALPAFRRDSSFSTWLYRIAYNTALSAMRRQPAEHVSLADIADSTNEEAEDELAALDNDAQLERLQKALEQLPPDDRALMLMFYMQEKTVAEISAVTRLSPANVKTKLHRTRKKLLLLMTDHF
ncbi:MAG: sigma-70 family RNA polymerase sigma factor [Tannerella sp.]|jgi:RNA polymerase sigma-70 factor (ECF subfamily)|nr:sigma-70 family RNA polymerase sigma factor [Tannerella sp.]